MKRGQRTNFDLFSFFEKSPDLVCLVSKEGEFLNVNPTVLKKLGYTREELFANPVLSYIHPEDLELTSSLRSELLKGKTLHNFQNRYITKKGNTIWLEWTSLYYPDQEVVLAIAKDITSRKKMEEEIEAKFEKFRSLASHFKTNLEQSRKFLAIELHEELAQLAFVARLDIEWALTNDNTIKLESRSRLEHAKVANELLINAIRRLSFHLSPLMLEELGLSASLEWLCREFALLNNTDCHYSASFTEEGLSQEQKLDFFRICQEALANIIIHLKASLVEVLLKENQDKVSLRIKVKGGDSESVNLLQVEDGIKNMQERASSSNALLSIKMNGDIVEEILLEANKLP